MIRWMKLISENLEARTNMIRLMIASTENPKARNAITRKSVVNTRNRTNQTHRQAIPIRLTTVTTDARNVKIRAIGKSILSNYAQN